MRKLVVSEFVSLDGVMEDPMWTFEFMSDEREEYKREELFASDSLLFGRVTFEVFASAWPSVTDEVGFADRMNSLPKHVASTTLEGPLDWNGSLLGADLAEEVQHLKSGEGGDILVEGSAALVDSLMEHDLVDELRLMIFPVVIGNGKKLFGDGLQNRKFTLLDTQTFPTGVVALTYGRKRGA